MDISLFMSAARPKWWRRMYNSLEGTKCDWEIVAVGPEEPICKLPENFRYYKCDFKPAQCYAAASHFCQGKLIGWTADDASYDSETLDLVLEAYKSSRNGDRTIFAQRPIENGIDIYQSHYFFWNCKDTPIMAPLGFMNREAFHKLGGYDRNFVSGQAENDIVMRILQIGGRVELLKKSLMWLHHRECHHVPFARLIKAAGLQDKLVGPYKFRSGYVDDRRYFEECWVKDGYGTYDERTLKHGEISMRRLLPVQPFDYKNILTVSQGPQGRWQK